MGLIISLVVYWLCRRRIGATSAVDSEGRAMEPVGKPGWPGVKNLAGIGLAVLGRLRQRRQLGGLTGEQRERYQAIEVDDAYFNDSFYFHCTDEASGDLIVTRLSRRGRLGSRCYLVLLVFSAEHGALSVEQDVALEDRWQPRAAGAHYVCEQPDRRWRVEYRGPMLRGHRSFGRPMPPSSSAAYVDDVHVSLVFDAGTPNLVYFANDDAVCVGLNLAQEPWTAAFWRSCLRRGQHCHYEQFGRAHGTLSVGRGPAVALRMGVFRDHSWDVRKWSTIDGLFIVMATFYDEAPLIVAGRRYAHLQIVMCDMPGNSAGVQRFTSGWLGAADAVLPVRFATAWQHMLVDTERNDVGLLRRVPPAQRRPSHFEFQTACGHRFAVDCSFRSDAGPLPRLQYWPDDFQFEVFEDSVLFTVRRPEDSQEVVARGYGGRQFGFAIKA